MKIIKLTLTVISLIVIGCEDQQNSYTDREFELESLIVEIIIVVETQRDGYQIILLYQVKGVRQI